VIEVFIPERFSLAQQALIQALSDPNLLTQRAALELLITHFTLQSRSESSSPSHSLLFSSRSPTKASDE